MADLHIVDDLRQLPAAWDELLAQQEGATPFMRRAYLQALQAGGSAVAATGWQAAFALLMQGQVLQAAAPLWIKGHSWGEYVFDQAWARAYAAQGLRYYPKGVLAVPFAPVPGARLLAQDAVARAQLLQGLTRFAAQAGLSGLHLLFGDAADARAAREQGWVAREQPQFHWQRDPNWRGYEDFLASLRRDKRKKLLQERRQVRDAGVKVRVLQGEAIGAADWAFFERCYANTYAVRGQQAYLALGFFAECGVDWLLFIAEQGGEPIAASLLACDGGDGRDGTPTGARRRVLWGRHWGCVRELPFVHFELCYHAPIEWAMAQGIERFEGGAQGEHKMARGLLPVATQSWHWLADAGFAEALQRFGEQEQAAVAAYEGELAARSPFR
jgi:predicted N-acyltransferase